MPKLRALIFGTGNFFGALFQGLTLGQFNSAPVVGETARYYKQLSRMSKGLALCADVSMLMLGGDLKRKEMISARLGDVLSHLYLASATLKHYEDQGRMVSDLPFVQYAVERNLYLIGKAFEGFFQNFPNKVVGAVLKRVVFPFGVGYKMPADDRCHAICLAMMTPGEFVEIHIDTPLAEAERHHLLTLKERLSQRQQQVDALQQHHRIVIAGRDSAQDSINQVGQEITRRNMNIQPTLTSRPGLPVRIIVNRDLVLRPYQPLFFNRGASQ